MKEEKENKQGLTGPRLQGEEAVKRPYTSPEIEEVQIDLSETMRMASGWIDD